MKPNSPYSYIAGACILITSSLCLAGPVAVMDFESVPDGTVFGASASPSHLPGDLVLTENGIRMSLASLFVATFPGSASDEVFLDATVGGFLTQLFPTQALELTNISSEFDLSNVPFEVNGASIEYNYFGGATNFSVNGQELFEIQSLFELPVNVAPGVTATVFDELIVLDGPITSVLIGGQELAIDNVTAVPEPTTALLMGLSGLAILHRRKRSRPTKY